MTPTSTYIYHITHYKNLSSILKQGGLQAISNIRNNGISYNNIAYQDIQARRSLTKVPVEPYGNLHDFVPFYFAPRSPMLYTLSRGNVPGHTEGQPPIVHLVSTIQRVQEAKRSFVFTDGHGIVRFTNFYNHIRDLNKVDWEVMKSKMWNDTDEDPDRSRRRQAEFLVYDFFPWTLLIGVGVFNSQVLDKVKNIIQQYRYNTPVKVKREWYY